MFEKLKYQQQDAQGRATVTPKVQDLKGLERLEPSFSVNLAN